MKFDYDANWQLAETIEERNSMRGYHITFQPVKRKSWIVRFLFSFFRG